MGFRPWCVVGPTAALFLNGRAGGVCYATLSPRESGTSMAPATATVAESGGHRTARLLSGPAILRPAAAADQQEQLQCPRCESTNTKFCYYNNYNLAQPRHFCKSCRRYWTKGGALRNIPIGGGSRKSSAKRHRAVLPDAASAPAASDAPPLAAIATDFGYVPFLASSAAAYGNFLALGEGQLLNRAGLGLGFAPSSLEEMFGFGASLTAKSMFPSAAPSPEMFGSAGSAWQLVGGGHGVGDAGDCFPWPELAISAPGGKALRP